MSFLLFTLTSSARTGQLTASPLRGPTRPSAPSEPAERGCCKLAQVGMALRTRPSGPPPAPHAPALPQPTGILRGHTAPISALCFLSSDVLLSGDSGDDSLVQTWSIRTKRAAARVALSGGSGSLGGVLKISLLGGDNEGKRFFTQTRSGQVSVWNSPEDLVADRAAATVRSGARGFGRADALALGEQRVVVASPTELDESCVGLWDARSKDPEMLFAKQREEEEKRGMCMDVRLLAEADRTILMCAHEDGLLRVFDTAKASEPIISFPIQAKRGTPTSFDVWRDAESSLAGFAVGSAGLACEFRTNLALGTFTSNTELDLKQQRGPAAPRQITADSEDTEFEPHQGFAHVRIRPDGRIAAAAGWDGGVRVFHVKTRKRLANIKQHASGANCLDYSPDSTLFACGGKDGNVSLWNLYAPKS